MAFGPVFSMSPMVQSGRQKLLFTCCGALLCLPLLLSWGGGVAHPALDLLALPGAFVAALPATLGLGAWLVVVFLCLPHSLGAGRSARHGWLPWSAEFLGSLGALSLLVAVSAGGRPLPWIAVAAALLATVSRRSVGGSPSGSKASGRSSGGSHPARSWLLLGAVAWGLAMRVRPFGGGVFPAAWEDWAAAAFGSVPLPLMECFLVVFYGTVGLVLARGARPAPVSIVTGALAAVVLEAAFGQLGHYWLSAACLGALLAAWPMSFAGALARPLRPALLLVAVCALAQLRPVLLERWNCNAAEDQPGLRYLVDEPDLSSLAVIPDNMPFLVVLADGGTRLDRLAPAGVVSESRALDPKGGHLVSPPVGTRVFARVMTQAESLRLEWWDTAELRLLSARTLDTTCGPKGAFIEPGSHRLWLACSDSADLLVADPRADGLTERLAAGAAPGRVAPFGGGLVVDRQGLQAQVEVIARDGTILAFASLGPWASGSSYAGSLFAVGRGPAGHVQVRGQVAGPWGRDPVFLDTAEGASTALGSLVDTVRVGTWPGRPLGIGEGAAVYVPSPVDARATRVDLEVPWHQVSVPLGGPIRQAVVDSASESLYGVTRCGLFELRIPSTFPWRDLASGKPAPMPAGSLAPGPSPATSPAPLTPAPVPTPADGSGPRSGPSSK